MWNLRVTAIGLFTIAFGMQAVRWLAGFRAQPRKPNLPPSSAGRPSPANSPTNSGSESQDDHPPPQASDSMHNNHSGIHKPSVSASIPPQKILADTEPASSNLKAPHHKPNGVMHQSIPSDDLPKASRALADHPLLGPSVYGASSGESRGETEALSSEMSEPSDIPVPETPKRGKTRVKRIRFEQPDANGFYSDHFQTRPSPPVPETQSSAELNPFRSLNSFDASTGPDARASVDVSPSAGVKEIHFASPNSSSSTNTAQQSPYADNDVGWSLPPFGSGKQLPNIPEESGALLSWGSHGRHPSFDSTTEDEDPTPFSAHTTQEIDLLNAPTEAGDAVNDEQVGHALKQISSESPPRRHSRSYSEPNLAAIAAKQQHATIEEDSALQNVLRSSLGEEESSDASPDYFRAQISNGNGTAQDHSHDRMQSGNDEPPTLSTRPEDLRQTNGETQPLLRLEIITGPSRGRDFTIDGRTPVVRIGRLPENELHFDDNEVSSHHAELHWCKKRKSWLVRDLGSLNGTRLNGNFISNSIRKPGKTWKLNSDDILLLGHRTSIKVAYLPNTDLPTVHSNLKLYAPPSNLQPCVTIKSEQIANLRAELGIEKTLQEKQLRLEVACLCHVGAEHKRRGKECEDVPFLGESGRSGAALYCVFDGHCGSNTSNQSKTLLPESLRKRMRDLRPSLDRGEGLGSAWEDVFLETDQALKTEDGCTATAVLVWKQSSGDICIQAANVGDSAAVLWRMNTSPKECERLTIDHRISAPTERQRLKSIGIELTEGSDRLYGLNVARCLGDHYLKEFGFTAVPSVSEVYKVKPEQSALLIIASDGLWDVADSSKVMEVASAAQKQPSSSIESIAQAVYQLAMDRRSRDDVTIIVLCFCPDDSFARSRTTT